MVGNQICAGYGTLGIYELAGPSDFINKLLICSLSRDSSLQPSGTSPHKAEFLGVSQWSSWQGAAESIFSASPLTPSEYKAKETNQTKTSSRLPTNERGSPANADGECPSCPCLRPAQFPAACSNPAWSRCRSDP